MTNFDQSKHPRSAAGTPTGGQFTAKTHSVPEATLEELSEPVPTFMQFASWTVDDFHAQAGVLEFGKLRALPTGDPERWRFVLANRTHSSEQWGVYVTGSLPADWDELAPWKSTAARHTFGRVKGELSRQHEHLRRRIAGTFPGGLIPSHVPVEAASKDECERELQRLVRTIPTSEANDRTILIERVAAYRARYVAVTAGSDDRRVSLMLQLADSAVDQAA